MEKMILFKVFEYSIENEDGSLSTATYTIKNNCKPLNFKNEKLIQTFEAYVEYQPTKNTTPKQINKPNYNNYLFLLNTFIKLTFNNHNSLTIFYEKLTELYKNIDHRKYRIYKNYILICDSFTNFNKIYNSILSSKIETNYYPISINFTNFTYNPNLDFKTNQLQYSSFIKQSFKTINYQFIKNHIKNHFFNCLTLINGGVEEKMNINHLMNQNSYVHSANY